MSKKNKGAPKIEDLLIRADITPLDELEVRAHMAWALAIAETRKVAKELLEQLRTLWQMVTDKSFVLKWETKAAIVGALIYFISPIDVIPDVVPGMGYLDDAVVVGWVFHKIAEEIARYLKHRNG